MFQLHPEIADGRGRLNERTPHIMIADNGIIIGDPRRFSIAQRRNHPRIRHRSNNINLGWLLHRQLPTDLLAHRVHTIPMVVRVWAREVNEFEHAMRALATPHIKK